MASFQATPTAIFCGTSPAPFGTILLSVRDFTGSGPSTIKATGASDYVILGQGDKLAKQIGCPKGI